jgi:hypothetical protein
MTFTEMLELEMQVVESADRREAAGQPCLILQEIRQQIIAKHCLDLEWECSGK